MKNKNLFHQVEAYQDPSTILFRSIELKLLHAKFNQQLDLRPALDLGCGNGIAALTIFNRKINYGLDNHPPAIALAKKSNAYQKIILAPASKIPLKNNSLKLVFSNCVLEHIKNLSPILQETNRVLKSRGVFIFTVPSDQFKKHSLLNYFKFKSLGKIYGQIRDKKHQHYHTYSLKKWSSILNSHHFKIVNSYYYLNKKTMAFWDFLFLIHALLYPFPFINKKIHSYLYRHFLKNNLKILCSI
jgi:SAM-dependent methyltransferase